jgi:polyisoprenoid-binding protein YceI
MATAGQATAAGDVSAGLSSGAFTGSWELVPGRSSVQLKTKAMWGMVPVKGTFAEVGGNATVTAEGAVTGRLEIGSASINTKMKKRDQHLRSDDFFASDRFPTILFEIDQLTPTSDGVTVLGQLTVRDRSVSLSFPATVTDHGSGELSLDAEFQVDRAKLGLDFRAKGATKMDNTLVVHALFARA